MFCYTFSFRLQYVNVQYLLLPIIGAHLHTCTGAMHSKNRYKISYTYDLHRCENNRLCQ